MEEDNTSKTEFLPFLWHFSYTQKENLQNTVFVVGFNYYHVLLLLLFLSLANQDGAIETYKLTMDF